jgi:hypothetical protein
MGPRTGLDDVKRKISCPYRKSNPNSSTVQRVASRYTDFNNVVYKQKVNNTRLVLWKVRKWNIFHLHVPVLHGDLSETKKKIFRFVEILFICKCFLSWKPPEGHTGNLAMWDSRAALSWTQTPCLHCEGISLCQVADNNADTVFWVRKSFAYFSSHLLLPLKEMRVRHSTVIGGSSRICRNVTHSPMKDVMRHGLWSQVIQKADPKHRMYCGVTQKSLELPRACYECSLPLAEFSATVQNLLLQILWNRDFLEILNAAHMVKGKVVPVLN